MSNKDLFKEAIADAKAVREAALANAKVALEEALAPKIQSMLSAKLQEIEELDEIKDKMDKAKKSNKKEVEEGFYPSETSDKIQDKYRATGAALEEDDDEELSEDFDLSEILAELSKEKEEEMNEDEEVEEDEEMNEDEEVEEDEEMDEDEEDETESDDKITDLTVDELKDIIKDIISAEMDGGDEQAMDMTNDMSMDDAKDKMSVDVDTEEEDEVAVTEDYSSDDDLEEIDLEELLAELDSLDETKDKEDMKEIFGFGDKKKPSTPQKTSTSQSEKSTCPEGKAKWNDGRCYPVVEDDYNSLKPIPRLENGRIVVANQIWSMEEAKKDEMKEAIYTIKTLRNELNEVNLLNAKLLYVNKIFKAKNLTESQKLKVIAQFDKATTTAEAKTIFEFMNSAIKKFKKSIVKESLGFASKAAGVAPKKPIVEVDATVSRWQMLAGINKF
jgi:hypothetical protein